MAEQSMVEGGNATIMLAGPTDPFRDGHTPGYLAFDDERHRPAFPLTSQAIHDHLLMICNEPHSPSLWKAGCFIGWIEALCENVPPSFRSFLPEERMTVLQAV